MGAPSSVSIKPIAFAGEKAGTLSCIILHENHMNYIMKNQRNYNEYKCTSLRRQCLLRNTVTGIRKVPVTWQARPQTHGEKDLILLKIIVQV